MTQIQRKKGDLKIEERDLKEEDQGKFQSEVMGKEGRQFLAHEMS